MARLKNIIHSGDACTMVFKGDKSKALEPSTGIIKFPGGYVEVARCSDGSYYAHIAVVDAENIIDSRIDYDYPKSREHGIPDIPDMEFIKKIACKIKPKHLEITGE